MKTKELLLECKVKLGIQTDYKLAQELHIPRQTLHRYMHDERSPDAYAIARIALCLGRDPATITAQIEAETETNPERRQFWVDFLQRAATGKRYMLALICGGILWHGGTGSTVEASTIERSPDERIMYIMSNIKVVSSMASLFAS